MSTRGDRGKTTEKAIEKVLNALNTKHIDVAFNRYPDARAAGGRIKAQPCDYLVAAHGRAYHIEVKETENSKRLAKDKISQIPVLRKFALAGIPFAVIVFHSELKMWRCIPQEFLDGDIPPSWDLSPIPLLGSAEEALAATGWFHNVQQ